ncbi:Baeyer-Villiger oxidase ptaJ [Fulvia fulva]|uniref:Baeyer-Villiger oxidase ptaJ n=1 Tax=Passalora fulva TaxID=5499 RepID=A0A9Q8LEH6_PASFU|nr:Baeyer-Villiger oxidase ptaJ [Fulvia fulva]KAK4615670.1 Baeyer-Villiger oxidase ptaJ [Fulvia fulva]KAK4616577.1 Baeyer-Villiger oxidase ptaJ [Fulvia fulva]UJO16056.1 Baeyer-Villiger oxidase ptaJ [Fulvia fulva]WPV19488.1 Baeyer-Villiger oxidase ptaJ [Fulvia fulva]WPV34513.1 Baeyer-Villiger oxidase ptaJ [Fulvia fulva]
MASASTVQLQLDQHPVYYRNGISNESTKKVSELMQENHEKFHIFFNNDGFHNHIAHQMLTMWALKASPDQIRREYNSNKLYQRPSQKPDTKTLQDLSDPQVFIKHLGPEQHYNDFLEFFKAEMEKSSWQEVINKYLFAGDERAETMLVRMYAGFLHPIIHLGFGIEFQQPAVIAEGLAQAACHDDWIGRLLLPAEKAAKDRADASSKSIAQLLDEIHDDSALQSAARWSDGNKIRDGILARAGDRMIDIAAQVCVKPEELQEKTAEMTNAVAYYTGGAQKADKAVKFDFYYIHCLNSSIFFASFLKQDWLSDANKVRLLEWKIRLDLAMYASRKAPEIRLGDIQNYQPKKPSGWDAVQDRVCDIDDDGHASKLVRAIANGGQICAPYEGKDGFRLKGNDWLSLAHMAIDSVELPGDRWVRSAGFDEAWEKVPLRANL